MRVGSLAGLTMPRQSDWWAWRCWSCMRRRAEREHPPALEKALDRCGVLRERDLVVVSVVCLRATEVRP